MWLKVLTVRGENNLIDEWKKVFEGGWGKGTRRQYEAHCDVRQIERIFSRQLIYILKIVDTRTLSLQLLGDLVSV